MVQMMEKWRVLNLAVHLAYEKAVLLAPLKVTWKAGRMALKLEWSLGQRLAAGREHHSVHYWVHFAADLTVA